MFNVGTIKTLSYLTSIGLLGGIGYTLYDYHESGQHETYFDRERAGKVLNGVKEPKPPTAKGLSYTNDIKPAIVGANWTGKPPAPPAEIDDTEGPAVPVEEIITPCCDILDVIAIIYASDNPAQCRCVIRMVGEGDKENSDAYYFIGDDLSAPHENIGIRDIKADHVVFSFANEDREYEEVSPSDRASNSLIARPDENGVIAPVRSTFVGSSVAALGNTAPLRTVREKGQFYVGTDDAKEFAENYDTILSRDISSETYFEDGKRAGIKITRVESDSIAAQHGMQSGDIIRSINGYPVSSKQEAIAFAKKNSDRYDIWQVEVENMGRVRTEVYHSPDK